MSRIWWMYTLPLFITLINKPSTKVCAVSHCPKLSAPAHGSLEPCSNLPLQTCQFFCDRGYVLTGSVTRTCNSDGTWTGTQPQCNDNTPPSFNNTCPNNIVFYAPECSISALVTWNEPAATDKSGYVSISYPAIRPPVNLSIGLYNVLYSASDSSGNRANCTFIVQVARKLCQALQSPIHGSITSVSCGSSFGSQASLSCDTGYRMTGSSQRSCKADGTWSGNSTICNDIQAPSIQCPPDKDNIPTEPGQSYANVNWKAPDPTDNSNEPLKLSGPMPPQQVNVGKKYFTYKVTDSSGLSDSCTFFIHVKDLEPPKFASCPDDIYKTSTKQWNKIFLPGVTVTDNVGVQLFTTSRKNGSQFTWGEHNITYTAIDKAGNTARCCFQVIIVGKSCPDLPTPLNGATACDKWLDAGKFCTLHCNGGYDFANKPPKFYFCGAHGKWMPNDIVPDCSSKLG